jgi:hypothetical protein
MKTLTKSDLLKKRLSSNAQQGRKLLSYDWMKFNYAPLELCHQIANFPSKKISLHPSTQKLNYNFA